MQTRLIADNRWCGLTFTYNSREKGKNFFELIWTGYQPLKGNKDAYYSHLRKVIYIRKKIGEKEKNIFNSSNKSEVAQKSCWIDRVIRTFLFHYFLIKFSTKNYQKRKKTFTILYVFTTPQQHDALNLFSLILPFMVNIICQ